jgi:hypothetical protein
MKEKSYTSPAPPGLRGLFEGELYLYLCLYGAKAKLLSFAQIFMFQTPIPWAVHCGGQNPFLFIARTICPIVYCLYRLVLTPQGCTVEDVDVIRGFILAAPGTMNLQKISCW